MSLSLLKKIMTMRQDELKKSLAVFLNKYYSNVIETDKYLAASGNIPVGLVAHLDTVFKFPPSEFYYDHKKHTLWSPDGLGADDRAGVYAIIRIIAESPKNLPSIIFTTDEEMGGLGARELVKQNCPFPNLKFLIELDRQGENDCVFYNCANPDFITYIESFGFKKAMGSFSDISFLMPKWQICGTNLSVGYKYEHSYSEILNFKHLNKTIEKVQKILRQDNFPIFPYISTSDKKLCAKCLKPFCDFELFEVYNEEKPEKKKLYCGECISKSPDIGWCQKCGEPYEVKDAKSFILCQKCKKELEKNV